MQKLRRYARFVIFFALFICAAAGAIKYLAPSPETPLPKRYAGMLEPEARVFNRACKDCHSNDTEWPWYSKIPPISLGVVADVRRGRKAWDISEWADYSKGRKLGFLSAIVIDANNKNMPPRTYLWMHRESELTESDRLVLTKWANAERTRLRSGTNH